MRDLIFVTIIGGIFIGIAFVFGTAQGFLMLLVFVIWWLTTLWRYLNNGQDGQR